MPVGQRVEPFSSDGFGPNRAVGILISHGFTGVPSSVLPWAQHLVAAGYRVRVPLLPGHGLSWQAMNATTWQDWYGEVAAALHELSAQSEQVFAMGLSMGGTLVTKLAADHPGDISGLVLVNPSFGTLRRDARFAKYVARFVPSRPGIGSDIKKPQVREPGYDRTPLRAFVSLQRLWADVVPQLAAVTAPILLFRSSEDHVVDELSGRLLHAGAISTTVTEVTLPNSYHVATLDYDADTISAGSMEFVQRLTRTPRGAP